MCVCIGSHTHAGQLARVSSLLPCEFQGSIPGPNALWQAPLRIEPYCWLLILFLTGDLYKGFLVYKEEYVLLFHVFYN